MPEPIIWTDLPPGDSFLRDLRTLCVRARFVEDQWKAAHPNEPKRPSVRSLYNAEAFESAVKTGSCWPGEG